MTRLSTALNSSLSGLALASRMTQTISNNVANALTEGYATRQVQPTARTAGGVGSGVAVQAITRNVDPALLADRRAAEASYGLASVRVDFYSDLENSVGLPSEAASLSNQIANFDRALIEASVRPEADSSLSAVLDAAKSLAAKLNATSDAVQTARMRADDQITESVDFINTTLEQIAELNKPMSQADLNSEVGLNRADARQQLIDQLSEYIPVRELPRENGTVMLFTPGGSIVLDGVTAELGFTPVGVITPQMTLANASLSGLTINGQDVSISAENSKIAGGRLAALFDLRDVQAPAAQTQLDAAARDLIERFQDPAVDPTLGVGDAGLFTDGAGAFDALNEVGIAGRISINALADPDQGGAVWRIRDGLGAVAAGPVGDATLINALNAALTAQRVPGSGGFVGAVSAAGLAAEVLQDVSTSRGRFSNDQAFAASRVEVLFAAELANGVDTDEQMQRLLLVEQAYAANARVISTIEELLDTLTRI